MKIELFYGLLLPLVGTVLGAGCVFFLRGEMNKSLERSLSGFAAGVMVAASVWSLLIPAMDHAADMGSFAFLPAVIGLALGFAFLLLLDRLIPHMHPGTGDTEGPATTLGRSPMLVLSVALHNLPEGMAVGVVLAAFMAGDASIGGAAVLALALGIAIQNFPEGAIISMPLRSAGISKRRSFLWGFLSAIIEPIGAALTLLAVSVVLPALPYLLAFAAGAMLYVVVEELIPEMASGEHSHLGTVFFALGFALMMALDVALG